MSSGFLQDLFLPEERVQPGRVPGVLTPSVCQVRRKPTAGLFSKYEIERSLL
jgi:hypothetical protein